MDYLNRVRSQSRRMQAAVGACEALILIFGAWYCIDIVRDPAFAASFAAGITSGPVTINAASARALASLIAVEIGLVLAALYCVWNMFGALATDEPLSAQAALWTNRAGIALVTFAVGHIVLHTAMSVAATMGNAPGQRGFEICFGLNEMLFLLIAGVMLMTGRVLVLAADVRADQRAFV